VKAWHVVALIGGGALLGALLCRPDTSLARAEFERDSLKVVADSLQGQDERRAIADAAAADSTRRREAAIDSLRKRADSLELAHANVVIQVNQFPDLVPRALVDDLTRIHAQAMRTANATSDSLRAELLTARRQKVEADTAAARWRRHAETLETKLDNALKHRRWGCVVGVGATVGPAIAGTTASLFGGSVGFSASCGRKFL